MCNVAVDEDKLAFPGEKVFEVYLPQLVSFVKEESKAHAHTTSYGA